MKNCTQVNIPTVDNTQNECEYIIDSKCVSVSRRSPKLKNIIGEDLNKYFELLDKKLSQLENMIIQIKKEQDIIINIINGTDTDNIGTWAIGD